MNFGLLDALSHLESSTGLIAIPGPEGYYLVAQPQHPQALARLRRLQPKAVSFLAFVYDVAACQAWFHSCSSIAQDWMNRYWPGPLAIALPMNQLDEGLNEAWFPGGDEQAEGMSLEKMPYLAWMQPQATELLSLLSLLPHGTLVGTLAMRPEQQKIYDAATIYNQYGEDVDFALPWPAEAVPEWVIPTEVAITEKNGIHLLRKGCIVLD